MHPHEITRRPSGLARKPAANSRPIPLLHAAGTLARWQIHVKEVRRGASHEVVLGDSSSEEDQEGAYDGIDDDEDLAPFFRVSR